MDVGLRPWREAVRAARVEVGQPTPVRNVTWEKGSASCALSPHNGTIHIGTVFAARHDPTSAVAYGVLLHELGHRHLDHHHRADSIRAAVAPFVVAAVAVVLVGTSMARDHGTVFLTTLVCGTLLAGSTILNLLLGQILVRGRHRRYEHAADDYATDVAATDALAALDTYTTLTGVSGWASSHPTPAERKARQRQRSGLD
jgi:Zn-dependent protease with chaperone function